MPGRGIVASYGARFWLLVLAIGVAAGLAGAGLMELLHLIQHLAWGYRSGGFTGGVRHASPLRRVIVPVVGGIVAGAFALGLARWGARGEVSEAIWLRGARLPFWSSIVRAVDSIVVVALGAALGREAAPQQVGAAFASLVGDWTKLPSWQRRLLVACGAGAGMAAVYNVPLGGALFALEVLLGTVTLPLVLPALATTSIATAVAWVALPAHAIYRIPAYGVSARQIVWALIIGPIAGLAAVLYVKLIERVHRARPSGPWRLIAPVAVFAGLGGLAVAYPELLGNGQGLVQLSLIGAIGAGVTAILVALKPIATAACLGSGAPGGLFTPTLAYGVLMGALLGEGWSQIWPGSPIGAYAVIGGAAVLAAAMQGPLAAIVLLLELTHRSEALMVPVLLAVAEATAVARIVRSPSIYSVRLGLTGPVPGEALAEPAG